MKNLILFLSLCFILFSCFEKEEEVTVVPKETPTDSTYIMECERVKSFIRFAESEPPREPRANIKHYKKENENIFTTDTGGEVRTNPVSVVFIDNNCTAICGYNSGVSGGIPCPEDFDSLILIETIWQDER